jgi:predicted dehydrogenase
MTSKGGGFTSMAGQRAQDAIPTLGVGMLGYAFMGKAHSNGLKKLGYMMYPPPAIAELVAIAGRDEGAVAEAAKRYGFARHYTDWRELIADERVKVFDNAGPNHLHAEPCIAAAEAGKHVFCEKPLGRSAEESKRMLDAVRKAGVQHMVAFNYRFVPALALARQLIQAGRLGRIHHFRAFYLQEWIMSPDFPLVWRLDQNQAGSGALGDLGSHIIDLARYLVGEPTQVMGTTKTFIEERPLPDGSGMGKVGVDDAFAALVEFDNGAIGTLEATRFAKGRRNHQMIEINGQYGTLQFNLERLNELNVYLEDANSPVTGFRNVLVTEPEHPFMSNWWPQGHIIGWEHTFVHEFAHFFAAIVNNTPVNPIGATFEDGYKAAVISDAIVESASSGKQISIRYDL